MGYTTYFTGEVSVDPPLNPSEIAYLKKFNNTRRMDTDLGPYYVDNPGMCGQDKTPDVRNYNSPPPGQPGLWCGWIPSQNGIFIEHDGGEKFYDAADWMGYLIDHFLMPNAIAGRGTDPCEHCGRSDIDPQFANFTFDHVVNGEIEAQGEEAEDRWKLVVIDNVVTVKKAKLVWED